MTASNDFNEQTNSEILEFEGIVSTVSADGSVIIIRLMPPSAGYEFSIMDFKDTKGFAALLDPDTYPDNERGLMEGAIVKGKGAGYGEAIMASEIVLLEKPTPESIARLNQRNSSKREIYTPRLRQ